MLVVDVLSEEIDFWFLKPVYLDENKCIGENSCVFLLLKIYYWPNSSKYIVK